MKRKIAKLVTVLLIISLLPTAFTSATTSSHGFASVGLAHGNITTVSEPTYVRVGLAHGSGAVATADLQSTVGFKVLRHTAGNLEELFRFYEHNNLTINIESGNIVARNNAGDFLFDGITSDMIIAPISFFDNGLINFNGRQFRGGISFNATGADRMTVINFVELEHYLYGVLHSEMSQGNPLEALKAQAVASRSFAVAGMGRHSSEGFDFCATTHCQVYRGFENEFPNTNQAVDATRGLVITHDGIPVTAHFFANSGGHTQSSVDVWGGTAPHLVGVRDDFSPHAPWTFQITFSDLSTRLQNAGHNVGTVQSVAITARNSSGAVSVIEIRGTDGTVELRNERFRTVLGTSNVRSMMFDFTGGASLTGVGTGTGTPSATSQNIVSTNGQVSVSHGSGDSVYVIGANGVVVRRTVNDINVYGRINESQHGGGTPQNQVGLDIVTSSPLVISGVGHGHGVGMPQASAVEMARQGFTFEQILKHFFTGIEIRQI